MAAFDARETEAPRGNESLTPAPRPTVTLHYAQSLDGRIATQTGLSQWISGPEAVQLAHELRAASSAVLVGSGTVLADDPLLTVRHARGPQPMRVVLDARGRLPKTARLFTDRTSPTIVVSCVERDLPSSIEQWVVPRDPSGEGVELVSVMKRLLARGAKSLLVEGGGRVLTAFLREGFVDRAVIAIAPVVLGRGVDAVGDLQIERLEQAKRFTLERVRRLGADVILELAVVPG